MDLKRRLFRLSIFINVVIMAFSVYYVKVQDSEWWGYTFIGISLLLVMLVFGSPAKGLSKENKIFHLLGYPPFYLSVMILFFILYYNMKLLVLALFLVIWLIVLTVDYIQKDLNVKNVTLYYATWVLVSWAFLYKYCLIPPGLYRVDALLPCARY